MDLDGCLFVSGFDIAPPQRGAFNIWYDDVHVPQALALPGFRAAHRYTRVAEVDNTFGPELLNVFEIESEDAFRAGWNTDARRATSDDFNRWSESLSHSHVGLYAPRGAQRRPGASSTLVRWIVMWNLPDGVDRSSWERWYWDEHVPLAKKMPGQLRYVVRRTLDTAAGSGFEWQAEQTFPSRKALEAAVASPEGRAVADDATGRVRDLTLMIVEETEIELR